MNPSTPNFIIQEGPEKGREIVIPQDGARIGRATENDINISDAAMSRFQCRMYYRNDFLHIMDLGSTNETLVNNKPVSDQALRYGDEVLIGESVLKVVNDGLGGESDGGKTSGGIANTDEPEPAPIVFNLDEDDDGEEVPSPRTSSEPPASRPAPPPESKPDPDASPAAESSSPASALEHVDLGFGRRDEQAEDDESREKSSIMPLILVTLVTTLVVFSVGILVLMSTQPEETVVEESPDEIQIDYERVVAEGDNIFRYAVQLAPDGTLSAEIHDIREQRKIFREKLIDDSTLSEFKNQLENRKDAFLQLEDAYERRAANSLNSDDLTLIFGREAKRVRVGNQPRPDAFTAVRELIEGFARTQLGLSTLNKPPAELRAEALDAWRNARDLYAKREVKNENLYQAIQKLREVKFLLQDIEPKPDYYDQALELEQEWNGTLKELVNDLVFEANRSVRIGQPNEAANYLRRILETFPEKSSSVYTQAYNNLVRLEQEMNR